MVQIYKVFLVPQQKNQYILKIIYFLGVQVVNWLFFG